MARIKSKAIRIPAHPTNVSGSREPHTVRMVVGHQTQTPLDSGYGVAKFFARPNTASTHKIVDPDEAYESVGPLLVAHAARSDNTSYANRSGLHIEITGYTGQTDYTTRKGQRALKRAAWHTAMYCKRFKIPARWLDVEDVRAKKRGITDHRTVTLAFNVSGGHTDVIPRRDYFMRYVRKYLAEIT